MFPTLTNPPIGLTGKNFSVNRLWITNGSTISIASTNYITNNPTAGLDADNYHLDNGTLEITSLSVPTLAQKRLQPLPAGGQFQSWVVCRRRRRDHSVTQATEIVQVRRQRRDRRRR